MIAKVSKLLHDSIAYALSHRRKRSSTRSSSAAASTARTDTFVGMYVNDLTLVYGERGRKGLERLMTEAFEKGLIPKLSGGIRFLTHGGSGIRRLAWFVPSVCISYCRGAPPPRPLGARSRSRLASDDSLLSGLTLP